MNKLTKLTKAWIIASVATLTLGVTTNIVSLTALSPVLDNLFGGDSTGRDTSFGNYQKDEGITDKASALANANKVNETTCEEGFVLLKNENNVLPLATPKSDSKISTKPKVSVFGKNSVNLAYGGSGSGGGNQNNVKTIYESLTDAGYEYNATLKDFYDNNKLSGDGRPASPTIGAGVPSGFATGETPASSYGNDVKSSFNNYNDLALVVISRTCGEGQDVPTTMKNDKGTKIDGAASADDHYLELDQNEQDMLQMVCENFSKVVLIINSSQTLELGFLDSINDNDATMNNYDYASKIQGAIWIGGPGGSGIMALGKILNGEVNPSGRTVDTYARDFTASPSYANITKNLSDKESSDTYYLDGKLQEQYYADYEEGIYIGYRYYETRAYTENLLHNDSNDTWYKNNVIYPFGYGLSYTNFNWTITNKGNLNGKELKEDSKVTVKVKVNNVGDYAGKDVVELYVRTPYITGEIEKADKVLCAFAKTETLDAKKGVGTVELTFSAYDLASYDCYDANKNGFKGYELDAGEYTFFVSKNAHESVDSFTMNVKKNIQFNKSTESGIDVTNQYDDADDQLGQQLSRANFEGTFPKARSVEERTITSDFIAQVKSTETNNPLTADSEEVKGAAATVSKKKSSEGIQLPELANLEYDDAKWDELLSKMTVSTMLDIREHAAFGTPSVDYITKPRTIEPDGPVGFTQFMGGSEVYDTCLYASEPVMGSTWNVNQAEKMGVAVGNEALVGKGDEPYTGWYAPAVNLHRSPFGGRNYEYYAEDSLLSGLLAASEIQGVSSKGVITYMKHFAVNDQETHRNGICTWLTEQTLREIYLKPFELAITKSNGSARGVMSSFNRIGTTWTGGDYRLLTTVLRNEWGFVGAVISDFSVGLEYYMDTKQMAYAGGDLNLTNLNLNDRWADKNNDLDVYVLKQCTKNYLYAVAKSNAMNGLVKTEEDSSNDTQNSQSTAEIKVTLAPWKKVMFAIDIALGLAIIGTAVPVFILQIKNNKEEK